MGSITVGISHEHDAMIDFTHRMGEDSNATRAANLLHSEQKEASMDGDARYAQEMKRVKELKRFYGHCAVYVIVNAFLLIINLLTSPHTLWFYWPLLGWG